MKARLVRRDEVHESGGCLNLLGKSEPGEQLCPEIGRSTECEGVQTAHVGSMKPTTLYQKCFFDIVQSTM